MNINHENPSASADHAGGETKNNAAASVDKDTHEIKLSPASNAYVQRIGSTTGKTPKQIVDGLVRKEKAQARKREENKLKKGSKSSVTSSFRVSPEIKRKLDRRADAEGKSTSKLVGELITQALSGEDTTPANATDAVFCAPDSKRYQLTLGKMKDLQFSVFSIEDSLKAERPMDEADLERWDAAWTKLEKVLDAVPHTINALGIFGRLPCLFLTEDERTRLRRIALNPKNPAVLKKLAAVILGDSSLLPKK
ncbi:hypothetical protein IEN85_16235 [Pelagicoccus sp. NFK12]|uniref:Uncharacterized protein n=1 Tax=Pelagicoccus enzymogenes TaxID=2773457 RepID=A0A927IIP5_9BACT|nr:hypothetical protein [Pelagicoccus enzymogenes]MBD5781049.1 hypothetical protein [Pelagicoccus enzymogenes]